MSETITPLTAVKRPKASMYQSEGRLVPRGQARPVAMNPVIAEPVYVPAPKTVNVTPVKTPPLWRTFAFFAVTWSSSMALHAAYYLN